MVRTSRGERRATRAWGREGHRERARCKFHPPVQWDLTPPPFPPLPAGKLGPVAWGGGLLCISLAAFFEYEEYKYKPAGTTWTIGEAVLVWVMLAGLVALVSAHFALGAKRHLHAPVPEEDDETGARSLLQ